MLAVPRLGIGNPIFASHFDGTVLDTTCPELTGAVQLTPYRTRIKTDQSKFGGASARFLGTPIQLNDSDDWFLGTGDFSISCWIRFPSGKLPSASIARALVGQWFRNQRAWLIQCENNLIRFYRTTNGTTTLGPVGGAFTWAIDTWYHIEVNRVSGTIYVFVDGNLIASAAGSENIPQVTTQPFIGSNPDGTTFENYAHVSVFEGWMDELIIFKGVGLHTSNFTPPVAAYDNTHPNYANVVLHMHFDGSDETFSFAEEVGSHGPVSWKNLSYISSSRPKTSFGQSWFTPGLQSFPAQGVQFEDTNNKFRLGALDFTISWWHWQADIFGTNVGRDVFTKRDPAVSGGFAPFLVHGDGYFSARRPRLYMSSNGSSWNIANGAFWQNDMSGGYTYVSISRKAGNIYGHSGGVLRFTIAVGTTALMDNSGVPFTIGNNAAGTLPCGCYVEDLRIIKGTGLYDNNNYTPPTTPFTI